MSGGSQKGKTHDSGKNAEAPTGTGRQTKSSAGDIREATTRAWKTAERLRRQALEELRAYVPDPVAYANMVCDLDDGDYSPADMDEKVRGLVGRRAWPALASMSQILQCTPGEAAVCLERWQRTRVVYAVDPSTANAVEETDWSETAIPGQALRRLPYPNPLVVLPEPVVLPRADGLFEQYAAFGVFGVRPDMRRCSSHDSQASALCLYFFGNMLDRLDGKPLEVLVPSFTGEMRRVIAAVGFRVVTPLTDATMEQRQELAAHEMLQSGPSAHEGFATREAAVDGIAGLTRRGLSLLVYISAANADVRRTRVPKERLGKRRAGNDTSAPHVYAAGFRVGSELRAAAELSSPGPRGAGRGGVQAHVRRAHLHTYRVGQGRRDTVVHWLPPTLVGGKPSIGTVQVVRPPLQ